MKNQTGWKRTLLLTASNTLTNQAVLGEATGKEAATPIKDKVRSDKIKDVTETSDLIEAKPGKGSLLLTIIRVMLKRLRFSGGDSTHRNRFFDREEQRKFELKSEAKRHCPNQLIDTAFKYRGDV
jgi:hypothetical protein